MNHGVVRHGAARNGARVGTVVGTVPCPHRHRTVVVRAVRGVPIRVMMCLDCEILLGQPIGRAALMKKRPLFAPEKA